MSFKTRAQAVLTHTRKYAKAYVAAIPAIAAELGAIAVLADKLGANDAVGASITAVVGVIVASGPILVAVKKNTDPEALQRYVGEQGVAAVGGALQEIVDASVPTVSQAKRTVELFEQLAKLKANREAGK